MENTAASTRTRMEGHVIKTSLERANYSKHAGASIESTADNEYRKHMKYHVKPVYCPYWNHPDHLCPHKAADKRDMMSHVKCHHPLWAKANGLMLEDESVACENCGDRFTRGYNMTRHLRKCYYRILI